MIKHITIHYFSGLLIMPEARNSEIHYRVGVGFCKIARYSGTLLLDYLTEHLVCELLALIVAYHRYLYLLLASEILVVVHLARHEGIDAGAHGVVEKERS